MAGRARTCSASRRSSGSPASSSSASRSTDCGSPVASRRCAPTCRCSSASSPSCGCRSASASSFAGRKPDLSITTNGATFRLLADELRLAGLDRVNISLDTLRRERFHEMTRRDELAPGARRHRGGEGGRVRAGQDQRRHRARRQRRRDRRPGPLRTRQRRRGAVHRVHAARRRRPLDEREGGQPGRDRRGHLSRVPARAGARARRRAGRPLALPRRVRHGRCHPDGHQAVLRRLRPGADHRRRSVPHLPVRHERLRAAADDASWRRPTTSWPPRSSGPSAPSGPATRSTRSTSSAPGSR